MLVYSQTSCITDMLHRLVAIPIEEYMLPLSRYTFTLAQQICRADTNFCHRYHIVSARKMLSG